MSALRIVHIPAFFIWLIGLVSLLNQFLGFSNDILNFLNLLAQQNLSGALRALISAVMVIIGFAIHGGIEAVETKL